MDADGPQDEVCAHCGDDIPGDEVVWILENGDVSLEPVGAPYHEACQP